MMKFITFQTNHNCLVKYIVARKFVAEADSTSYVYVKVFFDEVYTLLFHERDHLHVTLKFLDSRGNIYECLMRTDFFDSTYTYKIHE